MAEAIENLKGAQAGAIIQKPSLIMAGENAPAVPEYIFPEPAIERLLSKAAGAGQKVISIVFRNEIALNGTMIADRDFAREKILPSIVDALESNILKSRIQAALNI